MICIAKCIAIKKKSKAQGFVALEVGDVLEFTIPIKAAGYYWRNKGTLASYIKIKNTRTGEDGYQTFNKIDKLLKNYEFKQLNSNEM